MCNFLSRTIWPLDWIRTSTPTLGQSGLGNNGNKKVLHTLLSFRTGTSPFCCIVTTDYTYTHTYMLKHIQHKKDERTQFFRKIYLSHFIFERVAKGLILVMCERWVRDWTELQHIDPHSSGYHSFSFLFSWAAQLEAWGPSLCWDMVLIPASL